jgi:hypothetical protein
MDKKSQEEFEKNIKKDDGFLERNLLLSSAQQVEDTLTKYFLVIGSEQERDMNKYFNNSIHTLDEKTQTYVKSTREQIIEIISSIKWNTPTENEKGKKYSYGIYNKLKTAWVALEYFVLYLLEKTNKKKSIGFNHLPIEMDKIWIDFMTYYEWVKFWIQVTYRKDKEWIEAKEIDLHNIATVIDNPKETKPAFSKKRYKFNQENPIDISHFYEKHIPDIPVLFIINSETSRKLYKSIRRVEKNSEENNETSKTKNIFEKAIDRRDTMQQRNEKVQKNTAEDEVTNMFREAYDEWEKNYFDSRWPEIYLEQEVQNELKLISKTYTRCFHEAMKIIKKMSRKNDICFDKKTKKWIFSVSYLAKNSTITVSFFKKTEKWKEFIYSLKFYITNKAVQRLQWKQKVKKRKMKTPKLISYPDRKKS